MAKKLTEFDVVVKLTNARGLIDELVQAHCGSIDAYELEALQAWAEALKCRITEERARRPADKS